MRVRRRKINRKRVQVCVSDYEGIWALKQKCFSLPNEDFEKIFLKVWKATHKRRSDVE